MCSGNPLTLFCLSCKKGQVANSEFSEAITIHILLFENIPQKARISIICSLIHITKMHSVHVLLCIKPWAKAGRNNGQQGGMAPAHRNSDLFCLTPLFILREQVWVTGRAPEKHRGLKTPGSSEPEAGMSSNANQTEGSWKPAASAFPIETPRATFRTCSTQSSHWHQWDF